MSVIGNQRAARDVATPYFDEAKIQQRMINRSTGLNGVYLDNGIDKLTEQDVAIVYAAGESMSREW
jgi:hypothetical protein